jgi:hypothetical protein
MRSLPSRTLFLARSLALSLSLCAPAVYAPKACDVCTQRNTARPQGLLLPLPSSAAAAFPPFLSYLVSIKTLPCVPITSLTLGGPPPPPPLAPPLRRPPSQSQFVAVVALQPRIAPHGGEQDEDEQEEGLRRCERRRLLILISHNESLFQAPSEEFSSSSSSLSSTSPSTW